MDALATRIADVFAKEDRSVKVTKASQVPPSYDAITAEWLTDVLCRNVAGAQVTEFRLDTPDNGSSNRRRIFLTYNDAGQQAALPATVFCKGAEELANRLVLSISGAAKAEADFYNLVRDKLDIEAPVGLYAGVDPDNYASLIMLRDLGSKVTFCDDTTKMDWHRATSQMRTLAGVHSRFYEDPALGSAELPYVTWPDWWTRMMGAAPQFGESCDIAFGNSEDLMSERLFRRRADIWPATMRSVERHRALPKTIIHCDVHLKNWYVTADNEMGLSDWQCMAMGHWSRDVVYAMTTALTIEDRRKWEKDLIRYYLDQMASKGVAVPSEDDAWKELRPQLMTALAFWTITLQPAPGMPDMQPLGVTREFLRRLYAAVDDHDAVDSI